MRAVSNPHRWQKSSVPQKSTGSLVTTDGFSRDTCPPPTGSLVTPVLLLTGSLVTPLCRYLLTKGMTVQMLRFTANAWRSSGGQPPPRLTPTAAVAQHEVRRKLLLRFTVRNQRVAQGIRIKNATELEPVAYRSSIDASCGCRKPAASRSPAIGPPSRADRPNQADGDGPYPGRTSSTDPAPAPQRLRAQGRNLPMPANQSEADVRATPKARIEQRLGLRATAQDVAGRRMFCHFVNAMNEALRAPPAAPLRRR